MEGHAESSLLGSSGVSSDGQGEMFPEVPAKPRASMMIAGGGFRRGSAGLGVLFKTPRRPSHNDFESRRASYGLEEQSCSSSHVTQDELPVPASSNEQDNLDLALMA